MAQMVKVEQRGRVLLARLHNPPHNFMNRHMVVELGELVERADADEGVGAVILTGEHPSAFISHYDVGEILAGSEQVGRSVSPRVAGGALRATGALGRVPGMARPLGRSPAAGLVELRQIHDVFLQMNRADAVFVAAINGAATGGGCELALACDLRIISSEGGPMGQPEILVGLIPGGGGSQRLARLLGQGRAIELILEGSVLDAREAADLGLVHRLVPAADLIDVALATAERLSRRAPGTIGAAKRCVYEGGSASLSEGLHNERAEFLSVTAAPAAIRAMGAYVQELEELGEPPFRNAEARVPWLQGTAVDMTR
jgi:enoyl-CoA hydratase/carnithine racemase